MKNQNTGVSSLEVYCIILKSYRQTWFSLLMVCVSLLIGCAGLSAVLIINQGAKASYSEQSSQRLLPASHQLVASGTEQTISINDYVDIKRIGISKAVAILETNSHLYHRGQRLSQRRVELIGIDFLSLLNQSQVQAYDSEKSLAEETNKPVDNPNTTIDLAQRVGLINSATFIHTKYLQELGLKVEETLNLSEDVNHSLPALQSIEIEGLADTLILDIGSLQQAIASSNSKRLNQRGKPKMISRILILEGSTQAQIEKLEQWLPSHLHLESIDISQNNDQPQMTDSFYLNLFAMALLMFAVCLFIVLNAFNLLLFKRFPMLKVLRQLGVGRKQIVLAHAIEFFIFAALITAGGIIVGAQLALVASPSIRNIVEGLYGVQLGFAELTVGTLYIKVLLVTLAGIALALIAPFKQLNQYLSHRQHPEVSEKLNYVLMGCALVFAMASILIFNLSSQLALLLIGAALIILSGCCVLLVCFPFILHSITLLIPQKFTLIRLSMAQAQSLSRKTKVACCAFFIAATSNLGMNLMVDSFRDSTVGWLTQRLVAEYYLYSDDNTVNAKLSEIARQSNVTLYPRYEQHIAYNKQTVQLFSYPLNTEFQEAMVFENSVDNIWQRFSQGNSVLINQQFAIRNNLDINQQITINHQKNALSSTVTEAFTETFTIVGIIYDYGNPSGQILLPPSAFDPMNQTASIFALRANEEQIQLFNQALQNLEIDTENQVFETQALLSNSMDVFDRTFIITDSLNFVTLLVAALSLACTIVILLEQSRPQTMLLRAMGISAWQSRRLLLQQYLFLCLVAVIAATPFGILLSYILIEQINYHAFNWSYPLIINWANVLQLCGISILVVGIIISLPIMHTTKHSLAQELKCLN